MNILGKLSTLDNLTPNEETLVNYILSHTNVVLELSPRELSEGSFVSIATVYRLLKKLEQPGFNEFKVALASSINVSEMGKDINFNYPISMLTSTEEMITSMDQLYDKTLNETINVADASSIKDAVDELKKVSDIVTLSNDEEGIPYFFETLNR